MISLSTFNYDEISKSNKYILSLPTTRKEIVKEKFILAIGAGAGFLIMKSNLSIDMEMLNNFINKSGLIVLIALMVIMYFISYKISYKIYKNKEE